MLLIKRSKSGKMRENYYSPLGYKNIDFANINFHSYHHKYKTSVYIVGESTQKMSRKKLCCGGRMNKRKRASALKKVSAE